MKRRDAIKYFMSGLILPLVPARLQAAAAQSGRRLVLIELSGANDGLNTVIPYRDDRYYRLR
ncbi:MAG: twin-arginine translocation pathway signal protein, partial [Paracoccaceae bacterium]